MMRIHELGRSELEYLVELYDTYIESANDGDLYSEGWYPVCINEYLNNDFLEILEETGYTLEEDHVGVYRMVEIDKMRRVILMDSEGEYETFGQIWAEFLTDAPQNEVKKAVEYGKKIEIKDEFNELEEITDAITEYLETIGFNVEQLPDFNEYYIR